MSSPNRVNRWVLEGFPPTPTRWKLLTYSGSLGLVENVVELTTQLSVTVNGAVPSTKRSTLLVMPLAGSLRELWVVY
jgi:hypothetical protein